MWRADVDERRAIKIVSALLFPQDPEGKQRETEIVSGVEGKKMAYLNQRNLF